MTLLSNKATLQTYLGIRTSAYLGRGAHRVQTLIRDVERLKTEAGLWYPSLFIAPEGQPQKELYDCQERKKV